MSSPYFSSSFCDISPFMEEPLVERSATWPPTQHKRKSSTEQNAAMREMIRPWGCMNTTPPGCRKVSFSSWSSNFTASESPQRSSEDMLASILWAPRGTTPDYNPPPTEWAYLGADQPIIVGKPADPRTRHRKQQATKSTRTTTSPTESAKHQKAAIDFEKEPVKCLEKRSILTKMMESASGAGLQEKKRTAAEIVEEEYGKKVGPGMLSSSMLPTAIDSDSEDEFID